MEATIGGIFIVTEREVVWAGDLTAPQKDQIIFFFWSEITGKAGSQSGKENMISRV